MKVVGYSDPLSVALGDTIGFMVSCENEVYKADIVKLRRGGKSPGDRDFKETYVPSSIEGDYPGSESSLCHTGSARGFGGWRVKTTRATLTEASTLSKGE